MSDIQKLFGVKNKPVISFSIGNKNPAATEDYDIKKVVNMKEGTIEGTPTNDNDIANKKYVDDNAGGAPEGTAIKSTGEAGAVKFLREDGDGTCSWQTPSVGAVAWGTITGTVSDQIDLQLDLDSKVASTNYNTHVSSSAIHFVEGDIDHTAISNIGTNTHAQIDTHISSTALHFTEGSIDHTAIANIGSNTHDQIDTHISSSAIHFTEGAISIPASQISDFDTEVSNNTTVVNLVSSVGNLIASTHAQNTDTALGANAVAADHGTATTDMIVNTCYGTSATPPTANTTTEGAVYLQYTA